MNELLFIETGMGSDVHGQNITKAAVRAVQNAIHFNSMPGIKKLLPDNDLQKMHVHIKLGIPRDKDLLDQQAVKNEIPYGTVTLELIDGGMATSSGILLEDKEDKNDLMYFVIAAVEVGY